MACSPLASFASFLARIVWSVGKASARFIALTRERSIVCAGACGVAIWCALRWVTCCGTCSVLDSSMVDSAWLTRFQPVR